MARKKEEIIENESLNWDLDDIMSDRFGRYSKYIIQERALPDARDGLKPVQRRILYAMDVDGNRADKPHRKSAKTVGLVIGTYHPHGDSSVYEAMVRMSQDWKINVPLIDMHGNNGSQDDDPPAAMRYTEARLSSFSSLLLEDIDKKTVTMTNNYDDTELEPTVLPASFPLLLVNGSTGIASGYATNIAPHNFNEVIEATIYRLNHPDCDLSELMSIVKGPDFPTGGIVQGRNEIAKVFSEGKGKVVLRSKCEVVENRTNNQIVISEIPFEVIKCDLVKQIDNIRLNKDLDGLSDVRDESGRDGIRIVIDLKKDIDPQLVLNYLYKNTDLQINYSYNMIAIENHRPVLMSLSRMLDAFISFRKEVVLNRSKYLLANKEQRMHILEGLIKAVSILDDVIEIIRASKDKADSKLGLMKAFLFSDAQAEAIVNLRLYRLSSTDIVALKQEYAQLMSEISQLRALINSEDILRSTIISELKAINEKYVMPRKSQIEESVAEIVIDRQAMISRENVYLSVTRDGYIRRYSERGFQANQGNLPMVKEGDVLMGVVAAETLDTLLLFSSNGEYISLPVHKIDECRFKDLGNHLNKYVKLSGTTKLVSAILVKDFNSDAYIISISKNGMIKRSPINSYQLTRTSRPSTAMKLKGNDEVVSVKCAYQGEELILCSKSGYYTRYSSEVLTPVAANSLGVKAMNVKDDELVAVCMLRQENTNLILATTEGQFKRINLNELELTSRGAKGIRLYKQRKSRPYNLKYAYLMHSYDSFIDNQNNLFYVKDIPLMDKESTFASALNLSKDYYLLINEIGNFETLAIIDRKEETIKPNKESYEAINLFDELFGEDDA